MMPDPAALDPWAAPDPFANGANPFAVSAGSPGDVIVVHSSRFKAPPGPIDATGSPTGGATLTGSPTGGATLTGPWSAADPFENGANPFTEDKAARESIFPGSYPGATLGTLTQGFASGASQGAISTIGAPVDIINAGLNLGRKAVGNPPVEAPIMGSQWIGNTLGALDPRLNPAYTQPQNEIERIAKGVGAGVGAAVTPVGMVGVMGHEALTIAEPLIGASTIPGVAANAGVGAMAGAGSQITSDEVPGQYKPLAATIGGVAFPLVGLGTAAAVGAAGRGIASSIPPLTEAARMTAARAQVGRELSKDATDRSLALENLNTRPTELIPGSQGTTAQVADDHGLYGYEKTILGGNNEIFAAQNAARLNALVGVQPEGAVTELPQVVQAQVQAADAVAQKSVQAAQDQYQTTLRNLQDLKPGASPAETAAYFRSLRGAMEDHGNAQVGVAAKVAQVARTAAAPTATTPEQVGIALRTPETSARITQAAAAKKLYDALPTDMVAPTSGITTKVKEILGSILPETRKMPAEEAEIYQTAGAYGGHMPLANVNELRGTILSLKSELHGNTQATGRLGRLYSAVDDAVENAVENKAALDQIAVRRGQMAPEETLSAQMQKVKDAELAWQSATRQPEVISAGGGVSGGRSGLSEGVGIGGAGAGGETHIKPGNAPSGASIPGVAEGTIGATSGPLREANTAWRELKETHDLGVPGKINATIGRGQPEYSNAELGALVAHPKPTAGEDVRGYLKAVGDEKGIPAVQDALAYDLHRTAVNADGTFNPTKATDWITKHKLALDELPSQIRSRFENARTAEQQVSDLMGQQRQNLLDFDKSEIGKVAGLSSPGDVTKSVGSILESNTAPEQRMAELAQKAAGNPAAIEGLRRAVWEHVLDKFAPEGGTAPKIDQLPAYIASKQGVLSKVLSPKEIKSLGEGATAVGTAKGAITKAEGARTEALSKYDKGVLGQLKGLSTKGDVLNVIKGIFGARDGAVKMQELATEAAAQDKTAGNTAATDALKRAVQEHIQRDFVAKTQAGTSGLPEFRSSDLDKFMRDKLDVLKASGLSDEQVGLLKAIADDGMRSNRSISAAKSRGGSDTDTNMRATAKLNASGHGTILGRLSIDAALTGSLGIVGHHLAGEMGAAAGVAGGTWLGEKVLGGLREAGLDTLKKVRLQAMDPNVGHALMKEFPVLPNRGTGALLALRARQASLAGMLAAGRHHQDLQNQGQASQ